MKAKKTSKTCPIQKTAILLSDKWTMLIVRDLLSGPKRFCELEQSLKGISTRTLTLKLKKLDAEKIVKKTKDDGYATTDKGRGLQPIEKAMMLYGKRYL